MATRPAKAKKPSAPRSRRRSQAELIADLHASLPRCFDELPPDIRREAQFSSLTWMDDELVPLWNRVLRDHLGAERPAIERMQLLMRRAERQVATEAHLRAGVPVLHYTPVASHPRTLVGARRQRGIMPKEVPEYER